MSDKDQGLQNANLPVPAAFLNPFGIPECQFFGIPEIFWHSGMPFYQYLRHFGGG
jgi:hypothetical protein